MMWHILIACFWSSFEYSHTAFITEEKQMLLTPSVAGVGVILSQEENMSVISCGMECCAVIGCTGATYFLSNKTCTLLHVEDVLDDWKNGDDVTYISMDSKPGLQG